MNQALQQEIINYMFLRDATGKLDAMACLQLWFGKSHDTDNEIRNRYGELVKQAIAQLNEASQGLRHEVSRFKVAQG